MPRGSRRGERRGGRKKGTPNKATTARQDAFRAALKTAFAKLGQDAIDGMSPAQLLRFAMLCAAKAGLGPEAVAIAKDAAPYFDAKVAPSSRESAESELKITGGLPDD